MGSTRDGDQGSQTHQGEEAGLCRVRSGVAVGLLQVCHAKIQVAHRWNKLLTFNSIRPFCVYLSVFAMVSPFAKIFGKNVAWMCSNTVSRGQYLCVFVWANSWQRITKSI